MRSRTDCFGSFQLLPSHALVSFEELLDCASVVQMVEKCLSGNACAFKDQCPTHNLRVLGEDIRQFAFYTHTKTMPLFGQPVNARPDLTAGEVN